MNRLFTATEFEFRYRFWMIGLIFSLGFWLYQFDHLNVVQVLIDHTVGHDSPRAGLVARAAFGFGALCVLAAALFRTWAAAYLRSEVVQDLGLHAETVVADGPYRHTRNPLYVGSMLIGIGFGFLASREGFIVIVVGMAIFFLRLIGLEENLLRRERGDSFRAYCERVPRLLPALSPRVPGTGLEPRWGQAFIGEAFVWAFFLAAAAFAVTLDVRATWAIIGLVLIVYAVRTVMAVRKKT